MPLFRRTFGTLFVNLYSHVPIRSFNVLVYSCICSTLSFFLIHLIHSYLTGSHCKIASAAVELVAGHATEDSLLLEDANAVFLQLAPACPLLMFLWCYLLTLLNYGNHAFWARVLPLPKENSKKDEASQRHQSLSINVELVRTGATIVYCDFMVRLYQMWQKCFALPSVHKCGRSLTGMFYAYFAVREFQ